MIAYSLTKFISSIVENCNQRSSSDTLVSINGRWVSSKRRRATVAYYNVLLYMALSYRSGARLRSPLVRKRVEDCPPDRSPAPSRASASWVPPDIRGDIYFDVALNVVRG